MPDRPVFVVGFPRSGTTLTQSLIGSHPNIAAPPEMHYFARVARWAQHWGDLGDDDVLRRVVTAAIDSPKFADCGFDVERIVQRVRAGAQRTHAAVFDAIMRDFAERAGKARWCEKTPLQSAAVAWRHFPEAQVVHVVRDPRESVASALRISGETDPVGVARSWHAFTTRNVLDGARRGPSSYLRIRYEDLSRDPEAVLTVVFTFLGEEFDPSVVSDHDRRGSVLTSVVVPWQARVLEPIKPAATGAWRKHLTRRQRAQVSALVAPWLGGLGYPPAGRRSVQVGRLLNVLALPRERARTRRRRRIVTGLTPAQRYEAAVRGWRLVHESTERAAAGVDDAAVDPGPGHPLRGFGAWMG